MDKITQYRIVNDSYSKYNLVSEGGQRIGYQEGARAENERAQKLVDALEWIKTYGPVDELTVKFIDKVLNEWKGTGKEETKPTKIETCGHCGNQPASNYIGNQLYLCDECMEKHTEDCY